MRIDLRRGLVGLACGFLCAGAAAAQAWQAVESTDALTDEKVREVCSLQDEMRLCLSFRADGVWISAQSMGSHLFDSDRFPSMRVDRHKADEAVGPEVVALERVLGEKIIPREWNPRHVLWRAHVPSESGEWTDTPPPLISKMTSGSSLLVRFYISGGFQKDVTYSLNGFCRAAAVVYAEGAPPLACP